MAKRAYEDCILFLLSKAFQKAHGKFKKRFQAYGLTPVQGLVLTAVSEEEGLSAGEIGKLLVLDQATLSGILERLAEAGWIIKEIAEEDKRYLRIYLTPRARELTGAIIRERDEANEEIMGGLRIEERLLLKRMLTDLQR
ncbi:MAG: MarR family transcriptional regulator [Syntrophales bacterium]|jgi:DNA-binding MarR family transcriptional regulator|nr:MarR family transcriptional regulator [Syntrophales bacterium]